VEKLRASTFHIARKSTINASEEPVFIKIEIKILIRQRML